MKFGKEFASQMVPEWQEAYMNYARLKRILKDLHAFKLRPRSSDAAPAPALKRKMTLYRAFSGLTRRYGSLQRSHDSPEDHAILVHDAGDRCETSFLMAAEEGGEYEMVFFRRLDDEFNKVNAFYRKEVGELLEEADGLNKQMDALIALRVKVEVQNPNFHMFGAGALSPSEEAAEVSSATHVGVTATGGNQWLLHTYKIA